MVKCLALKYLALKYLALKCLVFNGERLERSAEKSWNKQDRL